jgi:tetratricopeptide (TPR) repeat protein
MINKININPKKQILIVYVVLAVVTFAVFWQVNHYDFISDDFQYVAAAQAEARNGITLDAFHWALGTKYIGLWNPLIWLSFMFDYQLFGLNAGGYHVANLILHILSTLLLFWLFNRMTGALWRSAFVAALFAFHPLHVESVAWIAERKDTLSAFFWILTLCLYVYYTEKPFIRRYLPVLLCFACALMSKPMVITLPIVMILIDYWPLGRFEFKETESVLKGLASEKGPLWLLCEKIPFFMLSMIFLIFQFYAKFNGTGRYYSLYSRIANATVSFVTYLERTFWPCDLASFYPFLDQLPIWQVVGAAILIIVISVAVIIMIKRLPYLFVGYLWYVITIMPAIGIIQVADYPCSMANRYYYLPSIGIFIMLAWGIPYLIKSEKIRKKILFPTAIVYLTILAVLTWQQCGYWKNNTTLFNHDLQVTRDNYPAHYQLGLDLFKKGNYQEAINSYNKAIRIAPDYFYAYLNRGYAYAKLGQYQLAIDDFNEAIRLRWYDIDAYNNLVYVYLMQGNNKLGCSEAQKACELGNCNLLELAKNKGYCR